MGLEVRNLTLPGVFHDISFTLRKGEILTPPEHHLWDEFCARFPYTETDDQLAAMQDQLNKLVNKDG